MNRCHKYKGGSAYKLLVEKLSSPRSGTWLVTTLEKAEMEEGKPNSRAPPRQRLTMIDWIDLTSKNPQPVKELECRSK